MSNQTAKHRRRPIQGPNKLTRVFLVLCLVIFIIAVSVQCGPREPAQDAPVPSAPQVSVSPAPSQTPAAPPPSPSAAPPPSAAPTEGPSITIPPEAPPSPPDKPILPEYAERFSENGDFIGWLSINGTPVDYPVMYSPEAHDFYLTHNFKKGKDKNGLLVLQADCDPYKPGTNLIIHGHNMKSGSMFGTLKKYTDKGYWRKHPTIRFDTLYEKGTYSIVSVFLSKVYEEDYKGFKYYEFLNALTKDEFYDFYKNIKNMSLYDTKVEAKFGDTFITLSTCYYQAENGRLVVVAKKDA